MNYEDILSELGGFSRYQIYQFVLLSIIYMVPAMQNFSSIFTSASPDQFCSDEGSRNVSFNCQKDFFSTAINQTGRNTSIDSRCFRWVFDHQVFESTIVTKYDLVCSYVYLKSMSISVYMGGFLIGSSLSGVIADRYGRLKIILLFGLITFGLGLVAPFAPQLWSYTLCRFFVGIGASGLVSVTFTMSTENVSIKIRTMIGMLINFGWTTGILTLSVLSYFIRNHVYLEIAVAIPALFAVVAFVTLQESPRWLSGTGRYERAEKACKAIAKFNNIDESKLLLTNSLCSNLKKESVVKDGSDSSQASSTSGIVDIMRSKVMRNVIFIIWFQYMVCSLIYYGLSLGIDDLAGSIHLNTVIAGLLEFPATLIGAFLARRFGRVRLLMVCYAISGLASLTSAGLYGRSNLSSIVTVTSMIGRSCVHIIFGVIFLYTTEVAPTSVRSLFVGTGSTWARVGGLLAPQIGLLKTIWVPLPFLVYGALPVVALALCFLLPETNGRQTPDTIEEGENFLNCKSYNYDIPVESLDETASNLKV